MTPTCDICNMKFSSDIFWDWHKVGEEYIVMCRNWEGKPYKQPDKLNIISNINNNYVNLGKINRN